MHVDVSDLLGLRADDLSRVYVAADAADELIADYHGRVLDASDAGSDSVVQLMIVAGDEPWQDHVPAAVLVDLIADRDARVHDAATTALRSALDAATEGAPATSPA